MTSRSAVSRGLRRSIAAAPEQECDDEGGLSHGIDGDLSARECHPERNVVALGSSDDGAASGVPLNLTRAAGNSGVQHP
jgi:hypothetical protein